MSQLRLHQDIGGYQFEGPYLGLQRIPKSQGIYAIVSHDGKQYYLLDVDYTKNIRNACQVNSKKECWEHFKQGSIHFAFLQEDELDEQAYKTIVLEIRKKIKNIPCG